jgi:hypothetical protein
MPENCGGIVQSSSRDVQLCNLEVSRMALASPTSQPFIGAHWGKEPFWGQVNISIDQYWELRCETSVGDRSNFWASVGEDIRRTGQMVRFFWPSKRRKAANWGQVNWSILRHSLGDRSTWSTSQLSVHGTMRFDHLTCPQLTGGNERGAREVRGESPHP